MHLLMVALCLLHIQHGRCAGECIRRSADKKPFSLISPCHIHYDHLHYPAPPRGHQTHLGKKSPVVSHVHLQHGYPAVYIGDRVYASVNRFLDQPPCVTVNMLPEGTNSTEVTGAAFSHNFLHLLFGDRVVQVHTRGLLRWLNGVMWLSVVRLVHLPPGGDTSDNQLATSPCCWNSTWCSTMGRFATAYSFHSAHTANGSTVSITLHMSEDEGKSYRTLPVTLPKGSQPVKLAQYPTQVYSSLFYNLAGKAYAKRIRHECLRGKDGCYLNTAKVADDEMQYVELESTMRMMTVLVTKGKRLLMSRRHDAGFEEITMINAHSLGQMKSDFGPEIPIQGFCSDLIRYVLVDAKDWVFLGSAQYMWESQVHVFKLGSKPPKINTGFENPSAYQGSPDHSGDASASNSTHQQLTNKTTGLRTTEDSHMKHGPRSGSPPAPLHAYQLKGRVLNIMTLTEDDGGGALRQKSQRVDMTPHLARLDADCQLFQLKVVDAQDSELVIDKNDSLEWSVRMSAAQQLAVRPVVLLPLPILVSRMQLVAREIEMDGSVTTSWTVAISSHPENMRKPYMWDLHLTDMQVTSTVAVAECPTRLPPAIPILVGCNPWLRLVALNKRTDKSICKKYESEGLTIPSTVKGDHLLEHQRKLRGSHAVYKKSDVWHVQWDTSWGCPLLSSHKGEFEPVLAITLANDRSGHQQRLDVATVMYDIHGLRDFQFSLQQKDMGCHYRQRLGVSWREANDEHLKHLRRRNETLLTFNPTWVLNTSTYIACDKFSAPEEGDGAAMVTNPYFEIFGVEQNKLIWESNTEAIHVFNFRVIDPLFTYCDLNLTIPVFYMHSSDVNEDTKIMILLLGVVLSLVAVVAGHVSQQVTQKVKRDQKQHMDALLAAADLFATSPFNSRLDLSTEHIKTKY